MKYINFIDKFFRISVFITGLNFNTNLKIELQWLTWIQGIEDRATMMDTRGTMTQILKSVITIYKFPQQKVFSIHHTEYTILSTQSYFKETKH